MASLLDHSDNITTTRSFLGLKDHTIPDKRNRPVEKSVKTTILASFPEVRKVRAGEGARE